MDIDPGRPTPAKTMADGHDYYETNRYVLFGHHFAAIAAAGPLIGPILAAQFGYLPGALWIIIGAVVAGAVHDMVSLFASVRNQGRSLPLITEIMIGNVAGIVASFAVLFILILTLAGLSISVVNAIFDSPWSVFTVICTIPIALLMGFYVHVLRPGDVKGGSLFRGNFAGPGYISGSLCGFQRFTGANAYLFQECSGSINSSIRFRGLGTASMALALPKRLPVHIS